MTSLRTSARARQWRFSAYYRLGHHWQQAGAYDRAQAAYLDALALEPDHRASLLNLAVTQIRLNACEAALANLVKLSKLETALPATPRQPARGPAALAVVYNRALALRYLGRLEEAGQWSERLAVAAYKRGQDPAVAPVAPSALTLHAGILLALNRDDDALLDRAAIAALAEPKIVDFQKLASDPTAIEWYVRSTLKRSPDARGSYNLACYLARLAELAPQHADALALEVSDHLQNAFTDPRLIPWAERDHALAGMRSRPEWKHVPAPHRASPDSANETLISEAGEPRPHATLAPARGRVIDDALALFTRLHVDAGERRARRSRDPLEVVEALKAEAGVLDEADFHLRVLEGVAGLRDPVTAYLPPPAVRKRTAVLPLSLTQAGASGESGRIFVASCEPWVAEVGLAPGTEITHWNGVPIDAVIDERSALVAAADMEGRRARALASLTHRPSGVFAPLDEDEVLVGYGRDAERAIHVEWEHRPAPKVAVSRHLQSIDPLVATIGDLRSPGEVTHVSVFPGPGGERFGHLWLKTFDVANVQGFVGQVAAQLADLPTAGLVLDVRGNGGGSIAVAEELLQLFGSPHIEPQRIEFRATDLTTELARAVPGFRQWAPSIDAALRRHQPFSAALPLAARHEDACNAIGRAYEGPVVLLVDALSAGATDVFIAGFVDHDLGAVVATAARGGMPGGMAWRADDPQAALQRPLKPFSNGAAIQLSVARMLRRDGSPLAEHPPVPDVIRRTPTSEVGDRDAGLLAYAAAMLAKTAATA